MLAPEWRARAGLSVLNLAGCPVCVPPLEMIDKARALAARGEVIFCSVGDMLRVPGSWADRVRIATTPALCYKCGHGC